MNIFKSLIVAGALLFSASAFSGTSPVSGDISLNTDYVFRGVSQTEGGTAAQANLRADINNFYISGFTSNVEIVDANLEVNLAAGFAPSVGLWDFDLGAIAYLYPNQIEDVNIDTWEVYGGVGYNILATNVGVNVSYSDDYFSTGKSWYTVVPVTYDNRYFELMGSVGYLNLNDADIVKHTTDYKVQATGHVTQTFDVYVAWTNLSPATDNFKLDFDIGDDLWTGGVVYKF